MGQWWVDPLSFCGILELKKRLGERILVFVFSERLLTDLPRRLVQTVQANSTSS